MPPMAPTIMVPVLKRKRGAQNQGAPANKKIGTSCSDMEVFFSGACFMRQGVTFSPYGTGAAGPIMEGALSKMDAASGDERTDDETECSSSGVAGCVIPSSPPFSWGEGEGAVAMGYMPAHGPAMRSDTFAQRNVVTPPGPGVFGTPVVGGSRVVQLDARFDMDEWGWFVDAADDEFRIVTTSR